MSRVTVRLTFLAALVAMTTAYGTGPPVVDHPDICFSMYPTGHGAEPSKMAVPFTIEPLPTCFKPGMDVEVEVHLLTGHESYFEGFFIQARSDPYLNVSHGVFSTTDEDLKPYGCWGQTANTIGHQKKGKYTSKTFKWTPPNKHTTNIHFLGTIVHETDEFWVGVRSIDLVYTNTCGLSDGSRNIATSALLFPLVLCASLVLLW